MTAFQAWFILQLTPAELYLWIRVITLEHLGMHFEDGFAILRSGIKMKYSFEAMFTTGISGLQLSEKHEFFNALLDLTPGEQYRVLHQQSKNTQNVNTLKRISELTSSTWVNTSHVNFAKIVHILDIQSPNTYLFNVPFTDLNPAEKQDFLTNLADQSQKEQQEFLQMQLTAGFNNIEEILNSNPGLPIQNAAKAVIELSQAKFNENLSALTTSLNQDPLAISDINDKFAKTLQLADENTIEQLGTLILDKQAETDLFKKPKTVGMFTSESPGLKLIKALKAKVIDVARTLQPDELKKFIEKQDVKNVIDYHRRHSKHGQTHTRDKIDKIMAKPPQMGYK